MGLFDTKSKRENEDHIKTALCYNRVTGVFLSSVMDPQADDEGKWVTTVRSYYDNRYRTIVIRPDMLAVFDCAPDELLERYAFDGESDYQKYKDKDYTGRQDPCGVSFTALGYTPLPHYIKDGVVKIYQADVGKLYAEVLLEEIKKAHPQYQFTEIMGQLDKNHKGNLKVWYFGYKLPALKWTPWF